MPKISITLPPITILKATPVTESELVNLDVDGYWLLGYNSGSSNKLFACDIDAEKYYIGCGDNGIYLVVSEVSQGVYEAVVGENSYLDASVVTENPYEEESVTISCDVTGTDPDTGQLIANISLVSASGDGSFIARNVRVSEDSEALIDMGDFEAI